MAVRDAKLTSKVTAAFAACGPLTDNDDVVIREFGHPVPLSCVVGKITSCGASLFHAISRVLGIRAQPKVLRIATGGVVAGVTDIHSVRNVAVGKRPSRPMRHLDIGSGSHAGDAVTIAGQRPGPRPALVRARHRNAPPESAGATQGVTAMSVTPTLKTRAALFAGTLVMHSMVLSSGAVPGGCSSSRPGFVLQSF